MHFTLRDTLELNREDCDRIGDIYSSCGWGDAYTWTDIRTAFHHTDYYLAAVNGEGAVLGFLRALTDSVLTTWLAEIIVRKDLHHQGIGTALMARFTADFEHTSIYALPLAGTEQVFSKVGIIQRSRLLAQSRAPLR